MNDWVVPDALASCTVDPYSRRTRPATGMNHPASGYGHTTMKLGLRIQMSVMMFIQFFIWGSWYVTAPNFLGTIGFKAEDFGWTYSVGPIAGMVSPFFVGMIADRFFAAQRVLGVMHLAGAALMFWATTHMVQPADQALNCEACHSASGKPGRLDWAALGYPGDPMRWGGRKLP